jgi:G:T-mismatch repair DNA endonuclease (very short patch repair protein)
VNLKLRKLGWRVLRIWEHELSGKKVIHPLKQIQRAVI